MFLLVAVKSSYDDMKNGRHDAIRASWGRSLQGQAHVKFFMGREITSYDRSVSSTPRNSYNPKSDEVILDCREGAVYKTRAICQYIISKAVDHVLIVNNTAIVYPDKILSSNYRVADYAGTFEENWAETGSRYSWAKGNSGYFLSRRAAMEVAETSPRAALYGDSKNDDMWVGQVLGPICSTGEFISTPLDESVAQG